MKFIDLVLFAFALFLLVYLTYSRKKFLNRDVYFSKLDRQRDLSKTIEEIENENIEITELIGSFNFDADFDNPTLEKIFKYNTNEEKLIKLKSEKKDIDMYLKTVRSYKLFEESK